MFEDTKLVKSIRVGIAHYKELKCAEKRLRYYKTNPKFASYMKEIPSRPWFRSPVQLMFDKGEILKARYQDEIILGVHSGS